MTRNLVKAIPTYGWQNLELLRDELVEIADHISKRCSKILNVSWRGRHCTNPSGFRSAVFAALAAVNQEMGRNNNSHRIIGSTSTCDCCMRFLLLIGLSDQALANVYNSIPTPTLQQVRHWQEVWRKQKTQLTCSRPPRNVENAASCKGVKTHFLTVASEMTAGLSNLLFSGHLSGITVQVTYLCVVL